MTRTFATSPTTATDGEASVVVFVVVAFVAACRYWAEEDADAAGPLKLRNNKYYKQQASTEDPCGETMNAATHKVTWYKWLHSTTHAS